jgi:hypothetical protein
VGEDAPSADVAPRDIDETREGGSGGAGKPDALGHDLILSLARRKSADVAENGARHAINARMG